MLYDYLENISFGESSTTAFSDVSSFTSQFSSHDSNIVLIYATVISLYIC